MSRRTALAHAAGAAGLGAIFKMTEERAAAQNRRPVNIHYGAINKFSSPSDLRITDLKAIGMAANYEYNIVRMETNQGVYGLGEGTGALKGLADAKSSVVGRNPLDISGLLASLRTSADHRAYSVIDICLHDLNGKVFGVPIWRLLGDKKRDRIRIYCDTNYSKDPKVYGQRMRKRKDEGFTFFKMDVETPQLIGDRPGAVDSRDVATPKGLQMLCEYIAAVRDVIGYDVPLAADHFGWQLNVSDSINYARAFEPYRLAWAEDILQVGALTSRGVDDGYRPSNWRAYKEIQATTSTPLCMGEALFGLEESFKDFIDNRAVRVIQSDPQNCGGLLELKRIADYAHDTQGIATAVHNLGSPVMTFAAVHALATIGNFLALECHAVDFLSWWTQLVSGVPQPIIDKGYVAVPDAPGLGLELNEPAVKEHLNTPGSWFESITPASAAPRGGPRVGWPHFNRDDKWVTNTEP